MKKTVSVLLIIILLSCVCSVNALSSDIALSGERTLTDRSFNFDSLFSGWNGFEKVYCHIREYNGDSLFVTFSDDELCVNNHDGIWSYDIKGKGIYLDSSKDYLLSFYTEGYKFKTHELFCSGKNLGKIAVCNQTVYEDPYDCSSFVHDLYWSDTGSYASLFCITQTGKVIGHTLPNGVNRYDLFVTFLKNDVENAAEITDRSIQETVDDLAYQLGYGYNVVSQAINDAEIDIEWTVSDSRLESRYDNSAGTSGESRWGSGRGSSYIKPDDADSIPYLLTDSGLIKTRKGQRYLYRCKLTTEEYISFLYGSVVFDHSGVIIDADQVSDDPYSLMFPTFKHDAKAYRTIETNQSVSFSYRPSKFITLDSDTVVVELYLVVTADSGVYQLYSSLFLEDEYKSHIDKKYYEVEEILIPLGAEDAKSLLGDVDSDGEVTIIDATFIQREIAGIPIPFILNESIADTDGDGEISIVDASFIQRRLAGLKTNENIGRPISEILKPDDPDSGDEEFPYLINKPDCPSCGSSDVAYIIYGYPMPEDAYSEAFREKLENHEITFGGCVIEPDCPNWFCNTCQQGFVDRV